MQAPEVFHARAHRITRAQYERMAELGFFRDTKVELIHGIPVRITPIGPPHSDVVDALNDLFSAGLRGRARVRVQQPFLAHDESEPEPDITLVAPGRYARNHPDSAFLIVEVAESSLEYDRETKAPLYAASQVAEYWIVDVAGRAIEMYDRPSGGRYARTRRVTSAERITPGAFPDLVLAVSDLFA